MIKNTANRVKAIFTREKESQETTLKKTKAKRLKHNHRKERAEEALYKPSSLKFQFVRFVSLLMIMSMLVTSNPAAPLTIAGGAGEFGQDVRYAYLTNVGSIGSYINTSPWNPIVALFYKVTGKGKKKQQQIAKIEITPRSVTIEEGEEVVFNPIAYDSSSKIVQGVEFKWEAVNARHAKAAKKLSLIHI